MKKIQHNCGVVGIYSKKEEVAKLAYYALYAVQHRGQESAGIAVSDGANIVLSKHMGLVPEVFDERTLDSLKGDLAIGHTRYSTCGSSYLVNAQPLLVRYAKGTVALAHNGNLVNTKSLRKNLEAKGALFQSTSDTELFAHLIAQSKKPTIEDSIQEAMSQVEGAYSMAFVTEDKLIAVVDPSGFRPLALGKLEDGYIIASETCALDTVNAEFVREIDAGEMIIIDKDGVQSKKVKAGKKSQCIFEYIYFSRPDSVISGKNVQSVRKEMGKLLWEQKKTDADMVIPVPDSGVYAAMGYAEASKIPYNEGLLKNKYVGRTFIDPEQAKRDSGVKLKLNPIPAVIRGKRLVLIDDSIVRGTTMKRLIQMIKEVGGKEVHLRITSPPVKYPCFYGIDTPKRRNLIASEKSVEEIREEIGADSLEYLTSENLISSVGLDKDRFCLSCFDGNYPLEVKEEQAKLRHEKETQK